MCRKKGMSTCCLRAGTPTAAHLFLNNFLFARWPKTCLSSSVFLCPSGCGLVISSRSFKPPVEVSLPFLKVGRGRVKRRVITAGLADLGTRARNLLNNVSVLRWFFPFVENHGLAERL